MLCINKNCFQKKNHCGFFILGPLVGDCIDDQFSITGALGAGSPTICGTNTGYHSKSEAIFLLDGTSCCT